MSRSVSVVFLKCFHRTATASSNNSFMQCIISLPMAYFSATLHRIMIGYAYRRISCIFCKMIKVSFSVIPDVFWPSSTVFRSLPFTALLSQGNQYAAFQITVHKKRSGTRGRSGNSYERGSSSRRTHPHRTSSASSRHKTAHARLLS